MNTTSFTQNRIVAPIFIGVALLVAILFLRPTYASYVENTDTVATLTKEYGVTQVEYDTLLEIKNNNTTSIPPETKVRRDKLAKKFDTSDIMASVMLNDFTRDSGDISALIAISSVSVNKGRKLPNGLSFGDVSIALQGKTVADIIAYITFLTQDSPYLFTIDSISLPIDTAPEVEVNGSYSLAITLGVYYYE